MNRKNMNHPNIACISCGYAPVKLDWLAENVVEKTCGRCGRFWRVINEVKI